MKLPSMLLSILLAALTIAGMMIMTNVSSELDSSNLTALVGGASKRFWCGFGAGVSAGFGIGAIFGGPLSPAFGVAGIITGLVTTVACT